MKKRVQGMNWIRQEKRLAIYLRDGLACAYCGASVEDGSILTLDHIKPYSKGGSNEAKNLITSCRKCNSSRGVRPLKQFISAVAEYVDHDSAEIERHIRNCRNRKLDMIEAKRLIGLRGSVRQVLNNN